MPKINLMNLKIARENVGMETFLVTQKITKSKKNLVSDWENGISVPTWNQINKLSKIYDIPELVLFSNETIEKVKKIPDYRVFSEIDNFENNYKIDKLINLTIKRQKWIISHLKENLKVNKLQGIGKDIKTPLSLANLIKEKLHIENKEIKEISGYNATRQTLNYLIKKATDQGIFVGKTISYHNISVNEMRGLYISNDYCPFIILNRKDALSAQLFSFIHELAHLFRKSDAISNTLDFRKNNNIQPEETFCNRVAIELLLPREELTNDFYDINDINKLNEIYKISKLSIFYRLKDLNKIKSNLLSEYEQKIRKETSDNIEFRNKTKKTGGNYYNNMKDSNGHLFNNIVANLYFNNQISYTEASNILKFSVEKI